MLDLSIIIPIYNEEHILESSINHLVAKIRKTRYSFRIMLVENGSTDNSWCICETLMKSFPNHLCALQLDKPNYGLALQKGIIHSDARHLMVFNADFWNLDFMEKAMNLLQTCDIVIGSKTLMLSKDKRPFHRRFITYWFNVFLRAVYNYRGTDTHGLKAFKSSTLVPLAKHCYPLKELFDTQLILRACKKGLIYTELPVTVKEIRPTRYSNLQRFLNLFHDLLIIFKYRYL